MRNPNRLDDIYDMIRLYHKYNLPDWRVGQFLCNFYKWYKMKTDGADFFYTEDNLLLRALKEFIEEVKEDA